MKTTLIITTFASYQLLVVCQLTKTIKISEKMKYKLVSTFYYSSPLGGAIAPHTIGEGNIIFEVITGGAVYDPANDDLLCGVGWVFVHLPGEKTVCKSEPTGRYECLAISFEVKASNLYDIWLPSFCWENEKRVTSFAHEILYLFYRTNFDKKILGDFVWHQFLFRQEQYTRREHRREIPPRISEVISYIDKYYTADLGIEELAAHVKLSASHLHARFKEFTGITPHQYLIRQRMRAARHILATSNMPIKAIASNIGYVNTESFCRAFKQHFGITAAEYRRKYMIY